MKKNKLILAVLFLGFAVCVFAKGKTETMNMATGGTTGTYYTFGTAVAHILGEKTRIPITVIPTGGSKANIQMLDTGDAQIAIVQNDIMDYAWRGVDFFNGEKTTSFSAMAALYAEACQIIVNPASGITTIADLKGKNVSVGDAGSGIESNAQQILGAYGITFDDITKQNLSFGASADAIRANKIDAFFCVAGIPTPAISNLADEMGIVLLGIDEPHASALIGDYPFYCRYTVPGGTYPGQNADVTTVAVKAAFIVSNDVPENTVYTLTKALFENKGLIEAAHAKGRELSPSFAIEGIPIPIHPGAIRYYKEIGLLDGYVDGAPVSRIQ
ncbi:MAG: TAXI family TRAP transporter solute-binding subunit [Treponema sp.]|nr:TAXI family TRAP transporter solute-binding subunit [Treponema sp.]